MANGFYYNGNTQTIESTSSLNVVTFGITGSLLGIASTASWINLKSGTDITINQVGTSFEISSSGGGGSGADGLSISGDNLILTSGSNTLSTIQLYPASSSVSTSRAAFSEVAERVRYAAVNNQLLYYNLNRPGFTNPLTASIQGSTIIYNSGSNEFLIRKASAATTTYAQLNLYSDTSLIDWGRNNSPVGRLTFKSFAGQYSTVVLAHSGNAFGRAGEVYFSRNADTYPDIILSRFGTRVGFACSTNPLSTTPGSTMLTATNANVIFGGPANGTWLGRNVSTVLNGSLGIRTTPNSPYTLELATDTAAKPSTNTWTITSDSRVKTNIQPYTKSLPSINKINPVTYEYNGKAGFTVSDPQIGVIAQDILPYFPECVKTYYTKLEETDKNTTELYTFSSHALTFALINTIKELNTILSNQKIILESLQNQLNNL